MPNDWKSCRILAAYYNGEPFAAPFRFRTLRSARTKAGKMEAVSVELCVWQRPNVVKGQTGKLEVAFEVADNVRTYVYPGCKITAYGARDFETGWNRVTGFAHEIGRDRVITEPDMRKGFWVRFVHNVQK